ncbi:GIY-YIG nuclease family protein [Micrococcus luteus]|uniref:GIY-YIG nuclease family protein n=1 Tax=Micrococcus luteus TaxID=1270 RepID=UPI003692DC9B
MLDAQFVVLVDVDLGEECLVAEPTVRVVAAGVDVGAVREESERAGEVGGKPEPKQRLRVIFENGTESSMYRQSLSIRLHEAEGQVLVRTGHDLDRLEDADTENGHIYVLRSLSDKPQIAGLSDLHKIGFSTASVGKRIANASKAPTYLMAPVEIVADYRTYNLKPSALEHLLHRVLQRCVSTSPRRTTRVAATTHQSGSLFRSTSSTRPST